MSRSDVRRIRESFRLSDADRERYPNLTWDLIVTVEDFDAMLNQVRAEAWDEGAEFMDSDHFWHDNGRGYNPYANRMGDGE